MTEREEHRPAAILLDLDLPDIPGHEYLTKPIDFAQFLTVIERQLEASGGGAVDQSQ